MPDHGLAYPTDRMRGHGPAAREWAVCRGDHPGSHYVSGEAWADNHCAPWIVTRGLTLAEAMAHMRVLNRAAHGGPGAGERIQGRAQSGGTG